MSSNLFSSEPNLQKKSVSLQLSVHARERFFRLREQKLVKFTIKTIKFKIQLSATGILRKDICGVQLGLGQNPQKLGRFR